MATSTSVLQSCLETCPPEVLELVTRRLEGADVMAMFLCGAPRLGARLFNDGVSSLRFNWTPRRYRIWYPFVMKFRNLRDLDIEADHKRFFSRFVLSPHFSTLEVLSLQLSGWKQEKETTCLNNWDTTSGGPLNLGQMLPNLQKLVLRGFRCSISFVALLPPSLQHLEMTYVLSSDAREYSLDKRHIEILPRSLTHLSLQPAMSSREEAIKALPQTLRTAKLDLKLHSDYDLIELFPSSLTLLEAATSELTLDAFHRLPSFIRTAQISVGPGLAQISETNLENLVVPMHVTSLKIHSGRMTTVPITMSLFPSNLTSLSIESSANLLNRHFQEGLPPTLLTLHLERCSPALTPEIVKYLPRGLKSLLMSRTEPFSDDWISADLPPRLLSLDMSPHFTWRNESLGLLPRSLINLNISRMNRLNDDGIRLLPPYIRLLNASGSRHITGQCFNELPRSLTKLMLDCGSSIYDHQISHLPRSLNYLRIWGANKLTDKCFRLLPRRLETLVLDGPGAAFSADRVHELPQSLTVLTFVPEINRTLTTAYFSQQFLMLDSDEREEEETPIYLRPLLETASSSSNPVASFFSNVFSKDFWASKFSDEAKKV